VFTRAGARIVSIATDERGLRPTRWPVLQRHHPSLVYLMPTRHNPLGIGHAGGRARRCSG
jgi:DNA-binding transcriptional MocR family regulator